MLLLDSTVYSFSAPQSLTIDGRHRSVRFSKHNLYGNVDWERGGSQFEAVRVFRPRAHSPAINWAIALVGADDSRLFFGENELGSRIMAAPLRSPPPNPPQSMGGLRGVDGRDSA